MLPGLPELGPASLASGLCFCILAAIRVGVTRTVDPSADTTDLVNVQAGDLQLWAGWALGWAFVWRASRGRRGPRGLFVVLTGLLLALSGAELAFVQVTGARIDFEVLAFLLQDAASVWMLVRSELRWEQVAGLAAAFAVAGAPLRWRPTSDALVWRLGILLLLWPQIVCGGWGRPSATGERAEIQPSLVEQLVTDGLSRRRDVVIPPALAELEPLAVSRPSGRPPNLVVVFLESVGWNATSLADPTLGTTPTLVRLATEGLLVPDATSVVPHTSKSLTTALCGQYPQLTRDIREARPGGLPGACLPQILGPLGYRTGFFQTARESFENRADLTHRMGFDWFRDRDSFDLARYPKVNYFGIEDRAMIDPGVAWSKETDGPFAAVYLTVVSHHDYKVPADWPTRTWRGVTGNRLRYLNAVRYVDDFVGRLVDAYRAAGLLDDTVFLVLGDHGEAFGEHGRSLHDLVLWEEGVRVPMILYGPGVLGGRTGTVDGPRSNLDVLPTLLDLVGVRITHGSLPGSSLLAPVDPHRVLLHSCWRSHRCLAERADDHTFLDHYDERDDEYFDLRADPGQLHNLADTLSDAAARKARLRQWRARVMGRAAALEERWIHAHQRPDDGPAAATWEGLLDLLGCAPTAPVGVAGQSVWLTCRWRAREPILTSWRLVVRTEGGFAPFETEWRPRAGTWPTWKWPVGWAVDDDVRVKIPVGAKPGTVRFSAAWLRSALQLAADDGRVWVDLATMELVPGFTRDPPPGAP